MMLTTRLDQRLLMNQQLKQAITILQSTTIELKQQIQQALDKNPLLELQEDTESDEEEEWEGISESPNHVESRQYSINDDYLDNMSVPLTLRDSLMQQTLGCHFDKKSQSIAEAIIDAIDEQGYLTMEIAEIAALVIPKVPEESVLEVLKTIQQFDPAGVGARSTQECLLLQLRDFDANDQIANDAKLIIESNCLQDETFDIKRISKKIGMSEEKFSQALFLIHSLEFNPGDSLKEDHETSIEPELYVKKIKQKWQVFLVKSVMTRLNINPEYKAAIKKNARNKSYRSILNELNDAQNLLSSIQKRNDTLIRVAEYIIDKQQDFLNYGREQLKAMNMIEVANALNLHESTISRITNGKYIATPHGMLELKFFFPSHVLTIHGEEKSSTSVKSLIEKIIKSENRNHAFSDDEIANILLQDDIHISRRTVAKYREALKIPTSYLRAGISALKIKMHVDEMLKPIPEMVGE